MSPGAVDCRMKTARVHVSDQAGMGQVGRGGSTIFVTDRLADGDGGLLVGVLQHEDLGQLDA